MGVVKKGKQAAACIVKKGNSGAKKGKQASILSSKLARGRGKAAASTSKVRKSLVQRSAPSDTEGDDDKFSSDDDISSDDESEDDAYNEDADEAVAPFLVEEETVDAEGVNLSSSLLHKIHWRRIVLDEAHKIK